MSSKLFHDGIYNITFCYILELENQKYYVGITSNLHNRFCQHFSGNGAIWTKLHKPIKAIQVKIVTHKWEENFTTLSMIKKYGVDNVRGGSWCCEKTPNISFLIDSEKSIEENYINYKKFKNPEYKIQKPINENKIKKSFSIYEIKSSSGKYIISRNIPDHSYKFKFFGEDSISSVRKIIKNVNDKKYLYFYTILYMKKYGIDNIRGGGITSLQLKKNKYETYLSNLEEDSSIEFILYSLFFNKRIQSNKYLIKNDFKLFQFSI